MKIIIIDTLVSEGWVYHAFSKEGEFVVQAYVEDARDSNKLIAETPFESESAARAAMKAIRETDNSNTTQRMFKLAKEAYESTN